jgi:predicted dehydrogenase
MGLRIAYIGAGSFTNQYMFPQLAQHGLDLAAVCDLKEERALTAQRRYGFGEVYLDFRRMLERVKPQAVFCVGGPKVHHEVGMEVLDRGFPLYVQKPPALGGAATAEMAQLAARKGVVCHVGFNFRSAPAVRQAKRIIAGEEFGRPLMGMFRYGLCDGKTMADAVTDQHCHLADLARFLMGEVRSLTVVGSAVPDARDYVACVRFESGTVGTLNFTSGQIIDKEFVYFEVTGQRGFVYSHEGATLVWRRNGKPPWWKNPEPDHYFAHGFFGRHVTLETMGYIGDVANFVAAVKGEEKDVSPIGDTVGTMALCEEMLRQIGKGAEA